MTAFFLFEKFTNKSFWKQVAFLSEWWPDIKRRARECKKGTGFRLNAKPAEMQIIYEPQ
jgi:hypothetical protein